MVLVDTSVIINFINRGESKELIKSLLSRNEFFTTEIIIMEVLQGIKEDRKHQNIRAFMESLPLAKITYNDYIEAANIYRLCRRKGRTIRKSIDCIIGAIAVNNNLKLFSIDKDFLEMKKYIDIDLFPVGN